MAPKNERLEIRIDPELSESIDDWIVRQQSPVSKSQAVRRLITDGLNNGDDAKRPVEISDGERIIIQMLFDSEKDPSRREIERKPLMEAIYGGHFWALEWEMGGLLHRHRDDPKLVKYVVDVMDMWSFIEEAWDDYSETEKDEVRRADSVYFKDPVFMGFDGNNESSQIRIARHLVDEMGRFQRFKGRDLNSHSHTGVRYSAMLSKFLQARPKLVGRRLSLSEIVEIFNYSNTI